MDKLNLFNRDYPKYQRPTLQRGSTGIYVIDLQNSLNGLNYLEGNSDGFFGMATESAVRSFQKDHLLPINGIVDQNTWDAIDTAIIEEPVGPRPDLKEGDGNIYVKELQLKLANLNLFHDYPNGIFKSSTTNAVKAFQSSRSIPETGIVNAITWRELNRAFSATQTPTPTLRPTIKECDTGDDVRLLQEQLRVLGYFSGEVNGIFNYETVNAVLEFQKNNNLEQNGIVDQRTWEALSNLIAPESITHSTIKEGYTGSEVIILQDKLKILGYLSGSSTGSFDSYTTQAVKEFQKDNKININGIVGPTTWKELFKDTLPSQFPIGITGRPTLRLGDTGSYVSLLQEQLKQLMFYNGAINGTFDNATLTAVKAFQTNNKLTADGVVGKNTWNALIYLYSPLEACEAISPEEGTGTIRGIVIDAGHGGTDPGAVGNGIIEKEYTLKISQYMENRFRELGIPVAMTRTSDETLSLSARSERMKSAFGSHSDVIMVSNHLNAGGGNGAETIYALRNKPDLARGILEEIGNTGQLTRRYFQRTLPEDSSQDYYYVIRNSKPLESVIVEYGFLDHPEDSLRIKQNWDKYAEAAVKAIMKYIGKTYTLPEAGKIVYVVKAGDTLFSIANRFDTTVDIIKSLNNLTSNIISIGQQLLLPSTGVEVNPPSGNIVYIVKVGDTLFSIANKFDTTVEEIKTLNKLTSNILSVGQQLFIPGVSIEIPGTSNIIHTVVVGDTLYSIANIYSTTVSQIKALNNLTSDVLSIGQRLLIPRPSTATDTFIYTVQSGDTLFSIANRFGTTVDEIKSLNNLSSNLINTGQQLIVPISHKGSGLSVYIVQTGDTLYDIANRFGTTVNEIMRINNLMNTTLTIGQQLLVPR